MSKRKGRAERQAMAETERETAFPPGHPLHEVPKAPKKPGARLIVAVFLCVVAVGAFFFVRARDNSKAAWVTNDSEVGFFTALYVGPEVTPDELAAGSEETLPIFHRYRKPVWIDVGETRRLRRPSKRADKPVIVLLNAEEIEDLPKRISAATAANEYRLIRKGNIDLAVVGGGQGEGGALRVSSEEEHHEMHGEL